MYQQYFFMNICKTCIIYLYICIVKIILWMCHHKTLEKFEHQNSSPIVLIKV